MNTFVIQVKEVPSAASLSDHVDIFKVDSVNSNPCSSSMYYIYREKDVMKFLWILSKMITSLLSGNPST